MLDTLRRHALFLIESSREAATPPDDEALLRALARAVSSGIAPTAGELLTTVSESEPSLFHKWSARAVAAHLKRYGLLSRKANGRHIFLVDTFIRLDVKAPIILGAYGLKRFIRFNGQYSASFPQGIIPLGFNNLNSGVVNALHQLECMVIGLANGHHKMIAQWKHGANGLCNRIIVQNGISDKGESGNFHGITCLVQYAHFR
jgi:hypothetical protein